MRAPTCITVPGLNGSGQGHWQTWAEKSIPVCQRVTGIDFNKPVLAAWADAIRTNIRNEAGSVILLAHSFGSLASVVAIADNETKVAGVILVAPASPQRFSTSGLIQSESHADITLLNSIPAKPLGIPGVVIASTDDPWMKITHARYWADAWGLRFNLIRNAGHINTDSGYGRWPELAHLVRSLRAQVSAMPLGNLQDQTGPIKNRFSALVKLRQRTREALE